MALESASQRRNRAKHGEALSRDSSRERDERDASETQPLCPCGLELDWDCECGFARLIAAELKARRELEAA